MNFIDEIPRLSADEKAEFNIYYNQKSIMLFRFSLIVFFVASSFYLYLDYISAPHSYFIFWILRSFMILFTIVLFVISFRDWFIKKLQYIANFYVLLYNFFILIMIYLSKSDELSYHNYYIGLIIIFIGSIPLRIRLIHFLYNSAIIIFFYIVIAIYKQNLTAPENLRYFLSNLYFILTSIVAVVTADYVLEIFIRKGFLQEKLLTEQFFEISQQKEEIEAQRDKEIEQKEIIAEQNRHITASIHYAKRLQDALMPDQGFINKYFENFIINLPRDIVSGDFYWMRNFKNGIVAIAVADCTGHGVPGAFVSMLNIASLQEFFTEDFIDKPHLVLNNVRRRIKIIFKQKITDSQQDGMDIALCVINKNKKQVIFSGANRPLWICRKEKVVVEDYDNFKIYSENNNKTLIEIKPDSMPIGVYVREKSFTSKSFQLKKNDSLYMFSDGFVDQLGENRKKLSKRFLKKIIYNIFDLPLEQQKQLLINIFMEHKGSKKQTDDVLFIGLRID